MAALDSLPDLEIHDLDHEELEVKTLEVKVPEEKVEKVEIHDIPDMDLPGIGKEPQEQQAVPSDFPKTLVVKKQRKALLWHTPEQDFDILRHDINPSKMDAFDTFIEENIPKDPAVRIASLKFIENVLINKSSEHTSKVFYNDGKNKSFIISFVF